MNDLDCCWCPARRFKTRQALADHEHAHRLAELADREAAHKAGTTLKDSRALAERLAGAAEAGRT